MATQHLTVSTGSLRALVSQMSSTPPQELACYASQMAKMISHCKILLSSPLDAKHMSSKPALNEAATLVTRLKTHLTTLVQHRAVEARWAGVVVLKAAVEAGGLDMLGKPKVTIQALLGILKKKIDPPTTRILSLLLLTRIFMLTWNDANLVRELTTPHLPVVVATCLQHLEASRRCSPSELQAVLEAFIVLIPRHPTIFRTHESRIKSLVQQILSGPKKGTEPTGLCHFTAAHHAAARQVWTLLQHTASKQTAAERWEADWKAGIDVAHATCDRIFRCIHENWESTAGPRPLLPQQDLLQGDACMKTEDALGLAPWSGVPAGVDRLVEVLKLLSEQLSTSSTVQVRVRVGRLADLLGRLFSVIPSSGGKQEIGVAFNTAVSRDERDTLFTQLPRVHSTACEIITTLLDRFAGLAMPIASVLIKDALPALLYQLHTPHAREASYNVLTKYIDLSGASLSRGATAALTPVLEAACRDLLGPGAEGKAQGDLSASTTTNTTASPSPSSPPASSKNPVAIATTQAAAQALLRAALSRLITHHIPSKIRAQIDRTAVLSRNKSLLLASVLHPPMKKPRGAARGGFPTVQYSLLPILAQLFPHDVEVEALLRPRMPVLRTGAEETSSGRVERDEDGENGEDQDSDMSDMDVDREDDGAHGDAATDLPDAVQLQQEFHTHDAQHNTAIAATHPPKPAPDSDSDEPTSSLLLALESHTAAPASAISDRRIAPDHPNLNPHKRSPSAAHLDAPHSHSLPARNADPVSSEPSTTSKRLRFDTNTTILGPSSTTTPAQTQTLSQTSTQADPPSPYTPLSTHANHEDPDDDDDDEADFAPQLTLDSDSDSAGSADADEEEDGA